MRLTIVLILIVSNLLGQTKDKYDYGRLKSVNLTTTKFKEEITPTLIYVKRNAEIHFKKSDIEKYIQDEIGRDSIYKRYSDQLVDLLAKDGNRIEIIDLLFDIRTSQEADSLKAKWKGNYSKITNHVIEFIGADLIYEGKFMLFDPSKNQFIDKGIRGKRHLVKMGANTFNYYMPDGKIFYSITTGLVE